MREGETARSDIIVIDINQLRWLPHFFFEVIPLVPLVIVIYLFIFS